MKKFLVTIILVLAAMLPSAAGESKKQIQMDIKKTTNNNPVVFRSPISINIETYYDIENQSLVITCDNNFPVEVFLYWNGNIIDYTTEINTSFSVSATGVYKIEIIGESWVAEGYLEI